MGTIFLGIALVLSAGQVMMGVFPYGKKAMVPLAVLQFISVLGAFLRLMQAYIVSDFRFLNVVQNSHTQKPLLYKITGVWGNHEGSLLLFAVMLSLFGLVWAIRSRPVPLSIRVRTLAVQGFISFGFLLFLITMSDPFMQIFPPPFEGQDLNPVLQDPALAFHPPFLYAGYVGFSLVFSLAVATLLSAKIDRSWAAWARPFCLFSWSCLTVGIALGSWWAYYELGWGGWWFWDPVENASLMPWLTGTALLHSLAVVNKRGVLNGWALLLAIMTFSLSLLGTFLVRSGILVSVHSFANDPNRGLFLLVLLAIITGGALLLYAIRAPAIRAENGFAPISREVALILNNLFLVTACATVFIGTLYPLVLEAITGDKITVGPPYFNTLFVPLLLMLAFLLGIGPLLSWNKARLVLARFKVMMTFALLAAGLFFYYYQSVVAALAIGLSVWIIAGTLKVAWHHYRHKTLSPSIWGMAFAHIGLAVTMAGIALSAVGTVEKIQMLRVGEKTSLAGYEIQMNDLQMLSGKNYQTIRGIVTLSKNFQPVATLTPEKRWYPVAQVQTTEAALEVRWNRVIYMALGQADKKDPALWSVRLYYHPFVTFIWLGAILAAFGGALSLFRKRR